MNKEEKVHESELPFKPKRTIVIPIDGSPNSDYCIEYALTIIDKHDLIILLNVRKELIDEVKADLIMPHFILEKSDFEKLELKLRSKSHELLQSNAKKLLDLGYHVKAIALQGDPRIELVNKINSVKPNFVIIGSRGLNKFARVFLGSVSNYVLHHVSAPVMVVPLNSK